MAMAAAALFQQMAQPAKHHNISGPQPPTRVGEVVGQHGTVLCAARATLADATDLLTMYDHTAAGVVDEQGVLAGVLTETDIVQAYVAGVPCNSTVDKWLHSGAARLPQCWMQTLTVQPATPLLEAAARMRVQAASEIAYRHLVVRDENWGLRGILSALDLVRALCSMGAQQDLRQRIGGAVVADVMKHMAALPICSNSVTMGQVVERMISARQQCVLVTDADSHQVLGVVTPRDVLRAFVEHVPLDTNVGHWLRGLQSHWEPRKVAADAPLAEAAGLMAAGRIHHLVVVTPTTSEVVGVLSASDLAQAIGSAERVVDGCSPRDMVMG